MIFPDTPSDGQLTVAITGGRMCIYNNGAASLLAVNGTQCVLSMVPEYIS